MTKYRLFAALAASLSISACAPHHYTDWKPNVTRTESGLVASGTGYTPDESAQSAQANSVAACSAEQKTPVILNSSREYIGQLSEPRRERALTRYENEKLIYTESLRQYTKMLETSRRLYADLPANQRDMFLLAIPQPVVPTAPARVGFDYKTILAFRCD